MHTTKTCENCKYFIQYYTKKATRFFKSLTACRNPAKGVKKNNPIVCEHWEFVDSGIQKCAIRETLVRMAQQIEDIAQILEV